MSMRVHDLNKFACVGLKVLNRTTLYTRSVGTFTYVQIRPTFKTYICFIQPRAAIILEPVLLYHFQQNDGFF